MNTFRIFWMILASVLILGTAQAQNYPIQLESLKSNKPTTPAAQGAPKNTGTPSTTKEEDCQLVAINDAARQAMQDKMLGTIEVIFNDRDFRQGLDMAATSGAKCVADMAKIWENLSQNFKIGNGLSGLLDSLLNIDPMALLGEVAEKLVEEACNLLRSEINKLFSSVTNLLTQSVDLGPLGNISTSVLIKYDGTGMFDINVNTPSTSSIQTYLDLIWK